MIKFLVKGILRDPSKSVIPIFVISIGVMVTVIVSGMVKGILSDIVNQNANLDTGHLKIMTKPYAENKLVRCTQGKVFEVLVDLRINSSTYGKWIDVILSSENHKMVYVPEGFALGFQTLEDNTELFYQMSQFYNPSHSKGIIWNDPCLKVSWPLNPTVISKKDQTLPLF